MRFVFAMRSLLAFAALSAALALATQPALAADGVLTPVDVAAGGIASAIVAAIAFAAKRLFGLTLDERHRATLHSALRTAAGLALSLAADMVARGRDPAEARSIAESRVMDRLRSGASDAISHFKLEERDLADMLTATAFQLRIPEAAR